MQKFVATRYLMGDKKIVYKDLPMKTGGDISNITIVSWCKFPAV